MKACLGTHSEHIHQNFSLNACAGALSQLDVARFAKKYPAVLDALLKSLLELICKYQRAITG